MNLTISLMFKEKERSERYKTSKTRDDNSFSSKGFHSNIGLKLFKP